MDIKCTVEGQKLKVVTKLRHFVRGSNDFVRFLITLDEDWEGLMTFAQFRQADNASNAYLSDVTVTEDGQPKSYQAVELPQWPKPGPITMMLRGSGNDTVVATTNAVLFMIDDNGFLSNASSTDLEPSLYEQLVNRFAEVEEKTQQVYITAADMVADHSLIVGMHAKTTGRWYANDGGAREYVITDAAGAKIAYGTILNPLAIDLGGGTRYAVPIITDQVTALDIGLERGRLRMADLPPGVGANTYANAHEKDDGWIAATNSAKLQAYLDAMPENGVTGTLYGGAHMNRIFFPSGYWYFRDSIVISKPVSFIGTRIGSPAKPGNTYPNYNNSTLVYLAEEFICVSSSQEGTTEKYVGDGCTVIKQPDPAKRGDENFDRTVSPEVTESAYIDHALFYAGAIGNVTFTGLDFRAMAQGEPAFEWGYHPNNYDAGTSSPISEGSSVTDGPKAAGWKPKGGKPWNPYVVRRHYKGVCAIIVRTPKEQNGKIVCKVDSDGSGTVEYTKWNGDPIQSGWDLPTYCCIDKCSFNGFSGYAVIGGRLNYLTDSVLLNNYVGYEANIDCFLYDSWIGNGFIGLVTTGHQPLSTSGMYIDSMAGFGVMASLSHRTFAKRTVKFVKEYDSTQKIYTTGVRGVDPETTVWENCYFCEHEKPTAAGRFFGHFDIVLDTCVMGGYFGLQVDWGAKISGIVERCGSLYNCDIPIIDQNKFDTQLNFTKAKEFWDNYETVYTHYGDATTSTIRWNDTTNKWVTSSDTDLQTITAYLDADMNASANVPKALKYISAIYNASGPDMSSAPPETYVWNASTSEWVDPSTPGVTGQKLANFLKLVKVSSKVFLYVDWLCAEDNGIQLEASDEAYYGGQATSELMWKNRSENFYKLVGTAGVSIMLAKGLVFSGQIVACSSIRESRTDERNNDPWLQKENMYTRYGFNVVSANDCQISGFSRNPISRNTGNNDTGMIMTPIIMQYKYSSLLLSAPTNPAEDKMFYLITNHNDASSSNWKYLTISLTHTPQGKVAGIISGSVKLTEGTVKQPSGDLVSGDTALSSLKLLEFEPYQNHYAGELVNVLRVPLYAASTYATGNVAIGDAVGLLIINFNTANTYIYCYKDYIGAIYPAFI